MVLRSWYLYWQWIVTITTNDLWQKGPQNFTHIAIIQCPGFRLSLTFSNTSSQKASTMNNLFLNLIHYKFIVKLAKWLNSMFCIVYLHLNDAQVFAENNYYMVFYFKMKQSMQSNRCKKACNFWAKLCEKAFLSNLIPIYLFTSLTCKQKL